MILKRQQRLDMLVREVEIMKSINHENLVNMLDCFLEENIPEPKMTIAMELMAGGCLTDVVVYIALLDPQISYILVRCLKGLEFMHESLIIHRDLKSDNVLLCIFYALGYIFEKNY